MLPAADDPEVADVGAPGAPTPSSPTAGSASSSSRRSTASRSASRRSASASSRPASCPGIAGSCSAPAAERRSRRTAPMPEGDTLFRTAAGLRPYLVGRRGHRAPGARAPGPTGRAGRRRDRRRGRGARQEPADPVRQRPRAADAPPDERLVASLPARRALAPAAVAGPPRPRGAGRRRGLLRRAGRRAVRAAGRGAPPGAWRRSGPDLLDRRSGHRRGRGAPPAARPGSRATWSISEALLDQRALAGIGNIWRNETLFAERVDPLAPVATWTTRRSTADRHGPTAC